MSRREQNKQANRQAILEAGREVFSSVGYEAASISDVVKASGLSVGTFYNYFGDKESVFAELVSEILEEARAELNDARKEARSLEEFVMSGFRSYSLVVSQDPDTLNLITKNTNAFREFVFGKGQIAGIFEDLERDMSEAIKHGILPEFPVRLMTAAMIGAGAEVYALGTEMDEYSVTEKAEFLGSLFLAGIKKLGNLS